MKLAGFLTFSFSALEDSLNLFLELSFAGSFVPPFLALSIALTVLGCSAVLLLGRVRRSHSAFGTFDPKIVRSTPFTPFSLGLLSGALYAGILHSCFGWQRGCKVSFRGAVVWKRQELDGLVVIRL
jgi:hypothetical protein